jgi:hypothetical protein
VKLPRLVFPGRTWLKLQRLSKQNERTKPVWQLPVGESSLAPILQNSSLSPLTNKLDRLSLASLIFQWQCTKPTLKVSSLLSEALTLRDRQSERWLRKDKRYSLFKAGKKFYNIVILVVSVAPPSDSYFFVLSYS